MRFTLLACNVITREACHCIARTAHTVDMFFTEKGEHNQPQQLRERIQARIDAIAEGDRVYDAVLLGYGLCGNATQGLRANRFPLVIPRAHDCTTLFLGGKEAFKAHFGACPSQPWVSTGYAEREGSLFSDHSTRDWVGGMFQNWEELVATYGEENAQYIRESLHVTEDNEALWVIDIPETRQAAVMDIIENQARNEGKGIHRIEGTLDLIEGLFFGQWPEDRYLVVPPGSRIEGIYDMDEIFRAVSP